VACRSVLLLDFTVGGLCMHAAYLAGRLEYDNSVKIDRADLWTMS